MTVQDSIKQEGQPIKDCPSCLFVGDIFVVGHDEVVCALHEAVELALAVGAQQVGTGFGDEDIVLAV